jgi:hypothetical protein
MSPVTPSAPPPQYAVFSQGQRIASGTEAELSSTLARFGVPGQVLVFDLDTGEQIEFPYQLASAAASPASPARPGRPKLGVTAREVTLMPQDWEWLNAQPGGASVALRKLVLKARRSEAGRDKVRQAQVVCYRFISAMAGNATGFEEATRALFSGSREKFAEHSETWPKDVQALARHYASIAFDAGTQPTGEAA